MKLPLFILRPLKDPDWLPKALNYLFALLAVLLILLGFLRPWFALPELTLDDSRFSTKDSGFTPLFKVALLLLTACALLIGFLLSRLRKREQTPRAKDKPLLGFLLLRLTLASTLLLLFFPTLLTLRDTETIGDAAWLQQQHDTMTWLGGDVYRAHSERSIESGTGVNAQDPPERLAVFRPPTSSLGIARLNDWIWWFGYGPTFTQFAGKGWFFSIIGYGLLTVCLLGYYWRRDISTARRLLKKLIVQTLVLGSLGVLTIALLFTTTRHLLRQSEEATAQGDYERAHQKISQALALIPSLKNDSGIIRQRGYFDAKLNHPDTAEAQLYFIFTYDKNAYHGRARQALNALYIESRKSDRPLPRHAIRELSRHQLRIAINDLNSAKTGPALTLLEQLLAQEPNCLQAHFHTQLASLQSGDLLKNRKAHQNLLTLYDGYKSKNKRGAIATSYWLLAQGEIKAGNTQEAWQARIKSKGY